MSPQEKRLILLSDAKWTALDAPHRGMTIVDDSDDLFIADIYGRTQEVKEIRADLIAAAPNMYKELKGVLAVLEQTGECFGNMDAMRAAIAKAEGRA